MTIKYGYLDYIYSLLNPIRDLKLYGANNLKKNGIISQLDHKLADFQKSRLDVFKKYANLDDNGNPKIITNDIKDEEGNAVGSKHRVDIPEDNIAKCTEEINELLNEEVDVNFIKVKWSAIAEVCEENPNLAPNYWTSEDISYLELVIDMDK